MTKKHGSYLGGHTVLTQHPGLRMRQLEIDAAKARKRAQRAQEEFDRERKAKRNAVLAKLADHDLRDAEKRHAKVQLQIKQRAARKRLPAAKVE
jgi:hypothetical protein